LVVLYRACTPPNAVAFHVYAYEIPVGMCFRKTNGVFSLSAAQFKRNGSWFFKKLSVSFSLQLMVKVVLSVRVLDHMRECFKLSKIPEFSLRHLTNSYRWV
jgi:hypothetical protein